MELDLFIHNSAGKTNSKKHFTTQTFQALLTMRIWVGPLEYESPSIKLDHASALNLGTVKIFCLESSVTRFGAIL